MQTMTPTKLTGLSIRHEVAEPISENLIRQSLLDAIDIIENAKHGGEGWFKIVQAGQTYLIHASQRLNDELGALLRGNYPAYCQKLVAEGKRRDSQ